MQYNCNRIMGDTMEQQTMETQAEQAERAEENTLRNDTLRQEQARDYFERITQVALAHGAYRAECIGLVPTENLLSPAARAIMMSDLSHRYLFQNPMWRYVGGKYLAAIEEATLALARQVFRAQWANVRALSGENCTNIMLHGLVRPGTVFYHVAQEHGGHFAAKTIAEVLRAKRFILPYDTTRAEIDIQACQQMFAQNPPDVIYLDSSMILFPHPVQQLRAIAPSHTLICYDGSQVLGLIAGQQFQDPLREGADFLSGSCHKSFPGPQKGIILTNRSDKTRDIEDAIFPGLVSNFHLHHVAALGITLAEELAFGEAYAQQTIANAKALAQALHARGFDVQCRNRGFTQSHQVWVNIRPVCDPDHAVDALHKANLIANINMIPTINDRGLRLGVPEITRLGMTEADMDIIAGFMAAVLLERKDPWYVREKVIEFSAHYNNVHYCFK
ncbi:serine hydroxymethyltransferase [Candidatus Woesearchaeota archaeon]|nr:serine hydroxymethyltransferase [Candidatus Woesearchaeota archaeon]